MRALCYTSSASHLLSEAELQTLLDRARVRNRAFAVTGLLLYCDGCFMQYLEGPAAGVETIWQIIRADPRHGHIITLFDRPTPRRLYAHWSMAYRHTRPPDFQRLLHQDWRAVAAASEDLPKLPVGVRMLAEFWRVNQPGQPPPA